MGGGGGETKWNEIVAGNGSACIRVTANDSELRDFIWSPQIRASLSRESSPGTFIKHERVLARGCQVSLYNFSGKLVPQNTSRLAYQRNDRVQLDSRTLAAPINGARERSCLIKSRGLGIPRVHEVTNSGLTTEVKGQPEEETRARKVKEPWRKGREPRRETPGDRRKD